MVYIFDNFKMSFDRWDWIYQLNCQHENHEQVYYQWDNVKTNQR